MTTPPLNTPTPISEALDKCDDPELKELVQNIQTGKVNLCACMGPAYGEPYCVCEMQRRGLPLNEAAREEDLKQFQEAMQKWFDENESSYS